jgi:cell division protein ZapE
VNAPCSVAATLAAEVEAQRIDFDPAQRDAARLLDRLAARLAEKPKRRWFRRWRTAETATATATARTAPLGIYLWGSVGRGKTFLMDLFCAALPFPERERSHFYEFMQAVHRELRTVPERADPLDAIAERIARRTRVLCLDEFHVLDIADAMILAGLLGGLLRRGVALVLTSNRAPQDLYQDGLQRQRFLPAIRLLETHLDVVQLSGAVDYRQRQLERAAVYWDSAQTGSDAEMRALFGSLHTGVATGPTTLTIRSRPVTAVDSSSDFVWFEFAALCETARSADDYLELARRYRGVFVSRVPVFTAANEDAARRFLMLVDALYDRGVALVLSAADEPAGLYRGDRLRFEFERAASRLVEMRSQRYLARAPKDPA